MKQVSRQQIKTKLQNKSTDELLAIWKENDRDIYSDATFSVIYELLKERNIEPAVQAFIKIKPPQKQESSKKKSSGKTLGCLIMIAFVLFLIIYGSMHDEAENGTAGWKADKVMAYVMAQQFVEERLVSPGSADFPSFSEANVTILDEREYRVTGYVDSQNKFGAMLRSNYVCKLRDNGDETWTCIELTIK